MPIFHAGPKFQFFLFQSGWIKPRKQNFLHAVSFAKKFVLKKALTFVSKRDTARVTISFLSYFYYQNLAGQVVKKDLVAHLMT